MKQRLFLTIFLAGVMLGALAQRKLSQSPNHSKYAYIYQLSADEATQLTLRSNLLDLSNGHGSYTYDLDDDEEEDDRDLINPGFLHTKIDSIRYEDIESYEPNLPPGYYLLVSAAKNGLDFVYWPVHNLRLNFINHGNLLKFGVTDLVGRLIDPLKLQFKEGRSVKYDARAKTFTAGKPREKNLIKLQYEGFTNIFLGQTSVPKKPVKTRPQAKTKVKKTTPVGETNIYKGYMVFNKPKYKPLDTVKFKAYLLSGKGKDLKGKPLRAELTQEYYGKAPAGKVIGMITPYRNGAYEYSFVLADSLQPRLDNRYHIVLREEVKGKWVKAYSGAFYYEDYELKSVNFSVCTNKSVYSPGSPVVAYLKAVDENELAVPDGRVKIQVLSSYAEKYGASHVFIKDTLWTTELAMDPVGETKLVIPDSIFPKANLSVLHAQPSKGRDDVLSCLLRKGRHEESEYSIKKFSGDR
ncbi:hypothetical protein [Pedobacter deserti]|uniref:hypothetical protein n=1 Tax=Pedobacter deserti TaxID=2817382 RepID=UPI0021097CEA|nr:hypothetical protein [Pedobacter sp. SYSU D00382]